MKSKKIFVAIISVMIILSLFLVVVACDPTPEDNTPSGNVPSGSISSGNAPAQVSYKLVVPDGAPALAIANLPSTVSSSRTVGTINKSVVSSAMISTEAIKSNVDMAIVPANLAAKIFNTSGGYKMLAVVTNGNLYMMSSIPCEVSSLQDLKGKMVYSIGQSSVPDMIFRTLLANENIEFKVGEEAVSGKVVINYCADGTEAISKLALAKSKNQLVFGIYGEPAVTNSKAKGFEEVFDLQDLWAKSGTSSQNGYAQAVLIARDKVCEDREFVEKLLEAFAQNEESILQDTVAAIANIKAIYPQSALPATMTSQVVERCNINTVKIDATGRVYFERTLTAVMNINANLIGGKLPSDDFYLA